MARNDERNRDNRGNRTNHPNTRDRKRDRVVDEVKSRPYAAAALATVAAGAAAFFLTRNRSDKPLMQWGQSSDGGAKAGESGPSSSSDGIGAGISGTSPSAMQAASLEKRGVGSNKSTTGKAPDSTTKGSGSTGLDETAGDQTKVGSVAYGA